MVKPAKRAFQRRFQELPKNLRTDFLKHQARDVRRLEHIDSGIMQIIANAKAGKAKLSDEDVARLARHIREAQRLTGKVLIQDKHILAQSLSKRYKEGAAVRKYELRLHNLMHKPAQALFLVQELLHAGLISQEQYQRVLYGNGSNAR